MSGRRGESANLSRGQAAGPGPCPPVGPGAWEEAAEGVILAFSCPHADSKECMG